MYYGNVVFVLWLLQYDNEGKVCSRYSTQRIFKKKKLRNYSIKKDVIEEQPLNTFLDHIQQRVSYKHWYFGHFHVDVEMWRNQTAVLSSIRELETGRIVKQWNPYEGHL